MPTTNDLLTDPPDTTAADPFAAATLIARRLAQPDVVAGAVAAAESVSRYPFGWGGASLHAGPGGSALLFRRLGRLAVPDAAAWTDAAHAELVRAVRSTGTEPLMDAGLSGGTSGIALVLCDALRDDQRYTAAVRSVAERLTDQVLGRAAWPVDGVLWDGDYDPITGASGEVTGLLAVLSARLPGAAAASDAPAAHEPAAQAQSGAGHVVQSDARERARAALHRAVTDLVAICTPQDDGPPRWSLHPSRYPTQEYRDAFPLGYVNLGLAHGMPGVMAALSLALAEQPGAVPVDDVRAALRSVADLLETSRADDEHGPNWPSGRPVDARGKLADLTEGPARTAWCYGAPGVALALLHASHALEDDVLRARADEAFRGVVRRVAAHGHFTTGTVCHGAAGVLLIARAFARRSSGAVWDDALALLTREVLRHVDPALPLAVQDWDQEVWLDNPGLLTGAAGTAAVLLCAVGGDDESIGRAFLAW